MKEEKKKKFLQLLYSLVISFISEGIHMQSFLSVLPCQKIKYFLEHLA